MGKDQTSNFPPRALQALPTTHEPSSSDNGWQLHSHHWLLQRPQLPHLLPAHSPDTAVALDLAGPDCTCLTAQQEGLQDTGNGLEALPRPCLSWHLSGL